MRAFACLIATLLIAGAPGSADAQHDHTHPRHRGHDQAGADTPTTREFKAVHEKMMRNMSLPYTGDPDVDFRIQMIPHHQGAIDMARVALRYAKDPWTRQAAEGV